MNRKIQGNKNKQLLEIKKKNTKYLKGSAERSA